VLSKGYPDALENHACSQVFWRETVRRPTETVSMWSGSSWHQKEVLWERRSQVLYPSQDHSRTGEHFFKTTRACVLTLRNAPEWPLLKERLDLNLQDLVDTTYADIFPRRAFLAQCNAPRLGSILKRS
jgi:hypothetical protein